MRDEKIYILDTSALLLMPIKKTRGGRYITTPEAVEEVRKDEVRREAIKLYIETGILTLAKPGDKHVREASRIARELGEDKKLSKADLSILGLAIRYRDKNPTIVTDDYSIQNILRSMGIPYIKVRREIRSSATWRYRCRTCGKTFERYVETCDECGGEVGRTRIQ